MSARNNSQLPNERARKLLKLLIQRFIRDGQPVGSRTLSQKGGIELSPATIRNVMSDLEELGFIASPHASAGRVPTEQGYRLFVDSLIRFQQPDPVELDHLKTHLNERASDPDKLADSVSSLLSDVTRMAGVVSVPKGQRSVLRQIEFLPLSDNRVLAILVINDREVQNRILHTDNSYDANELQKAANFINTHYVGQDLHEIRQNLVADLEKTRDSMNQAMLDIVLVAQTALEDAGNAKEDYVLSGENKLMNFSEMSDVGMLRELFETFATRQVMLSLLDKSIQAGGVQVFIGRESGYEVLDNCSIVTAPYQLSEDHVGVLGVIGPTRMAYDRVVPLVDVTARLLQSALGAPDKS